MEFDKKSMGLKIRAARKKKGYTQSQLAELISVSDRTVNLMETGKSGMTIETLIKFCNVLDVSPNYVLSYEIKKSHLQVAIENLTPREIQTIKKFFSSI